MAIVWAIDLQDDVSGPANAAAAAMGAAAEQARAMTTAVHGLASAMQQASAAARRGADGAKNVGESMFESVFKAELLKDAVEKVGEVAVEVFKEGFATAVEASENIKRLTATFDALGEDGAHAGAATIGMLRELEREVPQSEAQLAKWARTLEGAGMTDLDELRNALKGAAAAEALVEGGGERVKNLLAKLNEQAMAGGGKVKFSLASLAGTGVTEPEFLRALGMTPANFAAAKKAGTLTGKAVSDAIVKALSTKATGPLQAQMEELSVMETKAADSAKRLFEDVETAPLTEGVRSFFSVFDQSNPSGQVLKATITAAFNAIFRIAGRAFELLRVGFLHTVIFALQVAIAIKQLPKTIQTVKDKLAEWSPVIAGVGAAIFTLFVPSIAAATVGLIGWAITAIPAALAAAGAYIVAMGAAAIATLAATWPLLLIAAGVGLVVYGIVQLVRHWDQVSAFFVGLAKGAWEAAVGFVDGLVGGIENGISRAVGAVKKLGTSVVTGLKDLLGIHSPSAVMFELGAHTSRGFAGGIEGGSGDVVAASMGLSEAATAGATPRGGGRAGGGGDVTIDFGGVELHFDGSHAGNAAELRELVEEGLASLAERLALMVGSAPVPGTS